MARKVFFSFHYKPDNWRASQVRNAGVVEGNTPVSDNDWETITRGGDGAIQKWIDGQLSGKSCAVVLIGNGTAGRKWIKYEIKKAWSEKKGVLGIYVHNLKDQSGQQSSKGKNPFDEFTIDGKPFSGVVRAYDPAYATSTEVYACIKNNIERWVDDAIDIRDKS
jgi:hypothetical protein